MQKRRVRVLLGSDGTEARDLLSGLVEKQAGIVVGQAGNAVEALSLTRMLRPDIVILDCCLPHKLGLDDIPLSRASGLDVAQVIVEEIPNARVLLLENLDTAASPEGRLDPDVAVSIFQDNGGGSREPLILTELARLHLENPLFGRVALEKPTARGRFARVSDEMVLFGTLGVILGLMMTITGLLFIPGLISVALGSVAAMLGLTVKLIIRSFLRDVLNEG